MKPQLSAVLILSLVIAVSSISMGQAQVVEPITVTTDKSYYESGDTIVISGIVSEILDGFRVTTQLIGANGNLITIQQLEVNDNGNFELIIDDAEGSLWTSSGMYKVKVLYATESRTAETLFEYYTPEYPDFVGELQPEAIQSVTPQETQSPTIETMPIKEIPEWVKGVFAFWVNGEISDAELISAIEFLVDVGVIQLSN